MKSKKKLWIRFVIIMAFAVLFLLFALFAGKFAPYDPLETHYTDLLKAPCKQYLMGTDQMGRDIFSRILYGGKTSLLIAFVVTAIISVVGILIGTIAGFWGGAFDAVLMRLSDMLMAFPVPFYNCTCKLSWYRTSKSDFGNDHNRMDLLCKN